MKKKKIIGSVIALLAAALLAIYTYLGGFNPVVLSIHKNQQYTIIGNYYQGDYNRDSLQSLFFEAKDFLESSPRAGTLSIVNYKPGQESDSVEMVIGVVIEEGGKIPERWETVELQANDVVRAEISAHNLVMPTRPAIATKIQVFADKNELSLQPILIEKYISEDHLEIDHLAE